MSDALERILAVADAHPDAFGEWPLAAMREIEALRTGRSDAQFIEELVGLRTWISFMIRKLSGLS